MVQLITSKQLPGWLWVSRTRHRFVTELGAPQYGDFHLTSVPGSWRVCGFCFCFIYLFFLFEASWAKCWCLKCSWWVRKNLASAKGKVIPGEGWTRTGLEVQMCVCDESLGVCCGWTVDWSGQESRTGEELEPPLSNRIPLGWLSALRFWLWPCCWFFRTLGRLFSLVFS